MKYTILVAILTVALFSCKKKNFAYTCSCKNTVTGTTDTTYSIRVGTSGEANYLCKDYKDTANYYGKKLACYIR